MSGPESAGTRLEVHLPSSESFGLDDKQPCTLGEQRGDSGQNWSMNADERAAKTAAYVELLTTVTEILHRHDPVIGFAEDLPEDEYQPEAGTIIPRLRGATSVEDVQQIVHQELDRWFGPGLTGTPASVRGIAEEIWAAWNRIGPLK